MLTNEASRLSEVGALREPRCFTCGLCKIRGRVGIHDGSASLWRSTRQETSDEHSATIDDAITTYYEQGGERDRLTSGGGSLELVRTKELLLRYLPPPPASILDVGGGPGTYAAWFATPGYHVHFVDPIALHVSHARKAAAAQPERPFIAAMGDARQLEQDDATWDTVLLLGRCTP